MFGTLGIIIGIILILLGGYLAIFLPFPTTHQPEFGNVGIVLGFIFLIIGAILVFF